MSLMKPPKTQPPHSDRKDTDGDEDSDMDGSPLKRKKHRQPRENETDSSSDDAEQSGLMRIKRKKDKKLRRDSALAITSPMALGLKWLITDDPSRSSIMETAVLLRAIKPNSTTIEMVYKNPSLLDWDHPLIIATNMKMFQKQSLHYYHSQKYEKSSRIQQGGNAVIGMMLTDQLAVSPKSMFTVMNSWWSKYPSGAKIYDGYLANRDSSTTNPANRSRNLTRLSGLCIGFNFHWDGCTNNDCPYAHHCAFHTTDQLQHCTMRCTDNPNKWKPRRGRNNYKGGRGRGKGNKSHNHYHNQYQGGGHNQWQQPPNYNNQQFHPQNPPQFWGFPPHPNQQGGNKNRFFNQRR